MQPHPEIRFTIVSTSLGRTLIAATGRGVCAVSIDDDEQALQCFLAAEFPHADLTRDDKALRDWSREIVDHLEGKARTLQVPIDVPASAFQKRVWRELKKIPYGRTRSYSTIAAALGQPTATRAVARACATNPIAIVIPCHRVVHHDGSISGYRWGVERKRALLEREKRTSRDR